MDPIRVGLAGTGYAAKLRAETLQADGRSHLVAVTGHTSASTATFSESFGAEPMDSWEALVSRDDLDLVIIATVNRDHGAIAQAALQSGKSVVVEYPLSLDLAQAEHLVRLAKTQGKLLHVEHIELLSGIHTTIREALPEVGAVFYVRSSTINPQHPAPHKWTYSRELFGFPLIGALSRIHRLVDLFGQITTVSCQTRFWATDPDFYTACLCTAQLRFTSGLVAEVIYGKGNAFWQPERGLSIQGQKAALLLEGEQGSLVRADGTHPLQVGSRRGLFAKDTTMVLDHLTQGTPLYITPEASLYSLRIADAARRSAETGQTISI